MFQVIRCTTDRSNEKQVNSCSIDYIHPEHSKRLHPMRPFDYNYHKILLYMKDGHSHKEHSVALYTSCNPIKICDLSIFPGRQVWSSTIIVKGQEGSSQQGHGASAPPFPAKIITEHDLGKTDKVRQIDSSIYSVLRGSCVDK